MSSKKVKVVVFGTFAIVHPGHIHLIDFARKFGDHLTVVVATDKNVMKMRGRVVVPAKQRAAVMQSIKGVDEVIIGSNENKYSILKKIRPDVIVLGPDQEESTYFLQYNLDKMKLKSKIVRLKKKLKDHASSKLAKVVGI